MSLLRPWCLLLLASLTVEDVASAFRSPSSCPIIAVRPATPSRPIHCRKYNALQLMSSSIDHNISDKRRAFLLSSSRLFLPSVAALLSSPEVTNAASSPVQRAVGSAEKQCRAEGNCLEKFDLDGAVGWNWGGVDRCDALDPTCGPDGRLREEGVPKGRPIPETIINDVKYEITDIVELTMTIGTGSYASTGTIRMGLYGNNCPESVKEMIDLCSKSGLVTSKDLLLGSPVRLGRGSMTYVRPEERVDFGIPSQRVAYARSIRKAKAPEEYVPQARPSGVRLQLVRDEVSSRPHDVAGLISIPKEGIGYGGGLVLGKDDEAYSSAFQITAGPTLSEMDKEGRKVIGQLLDSESMNTLARLAGSPFRKILPGQNGGMC